MAAAALADAGYGDRPFDRERTSLVFGAETGTDLAQAYGFRAALPHFVGHVPETLAGLPELTEDSFPACCRTFDAAADGISLGEGVGCVVLKRLADAERDADRILAVIESVGASSDGRSLGLTAPRREGQRRALERGYDRAGVSPAAVGLVEAHGTGTVVGDRAELATLTRRRTHRTGACCCPPSTSPSRTRRTTRRPVRSSSATRRGPGWATTGVPP